MSSTPSTLSMSSLLSTCHSLAEKAGEAIRRIYDSGELGAVDKADGGSSQAASAAADLVDPQTLADLAAQRIIVGGLKTKFPGLTIVGEEGDLELSANDSVLSSPTELGVSFPPVIDSVPFKDVAVWVDPLDGTKEFTLGYVHYVTVLIGVSVAGVAVGGVVHVPFYGGKYQRKFDPLNPNAAQSSSSSANNKEGMTVWGCVGVGVHGCEDEMRAPVPGKLRITTSRTHFSTQLEQVIATWKPDEIIRCGGAGSKGLLVLYRQADVYAYPQVGTKKWDTCAIHALICAAGGQFTDMYGDPIVYDPTASDYGNQHGLLATITDHHKFIIKPEEAKSNL